MLRPAERDKLLIRLDERTGNIWAIVEKLEKRQAEQNGQIHRLFLSNARNTVWRRVIIGVGSMALIGLANWLARLQGLW